MTYADDITAPGGDYEYDAEDDLDVEDDEDDAGDEDAEPDDAGPEGAEDRRS